jgi:hypothetical protein
MAIKDAAEVGIQALGNMLLTLKELVLQQTILTQAKMVLVNPMDLE